MELSYYLLFMLFWSKPPRFLDSSMILGTWQPVDIIDFFVPQRFQAVTQPP